MKTFLLHKSSASYVPANMITRIQPPHSIVRMWMVHTVENSPYFLSPTEDADVIDQLVTYFGIPTNK